MGKREARIERKLQKALEQKAKNVRLREIVAAEATPRVIENPTSERSPRATASPQSLMQMRMEYRILDSADRDGSWTWGQGRNWCSPEFNNDQSCTVRATMIAMSALYWHEIHAQVSGGHNKHHTQSWDSICREAQDRWIEVGRTEDELFRFRTSGKGRIWGYREGNVFFVVWWDSEHQIYPVD